MYSGTGFGLVSVIMISLFFYFYNCKASGLIIMEENPYRF